MFQRHMFHICAVPGTYLPNILCSQGPMFPSSILCTMGTYWEAIVGTCHKGFLFPVFLHLNIISLRLSELITWIKVKGLGCCVYIGILFMEYFNLMGSNLT